MPSKIFTLIFFIIALSACSSAPSHLIVAPDVAVSTHLISENKHAQLTVTDMRTSNHIVQILKEDEAATILSSQERLENIIKKNLSDNWQKQGLTIAALAATSININIEKAVISVEQKTMKYNTQSEIIINVTINNGEQTLTNTFKNRGNSEGALQADIAVLERDFNQNLNALLLSILNSKDIKAFL